MTCPEYALFGQPVELSVSPQIHQFFAESLNQKIKYRKYEISGEEFEKAVKSFFAKGGKGLNITVPHKQAAFQMADVVSKAAKQAGAANTLWKINGLIHADNTDGRGFINDLLQKKISVKNQSIIVVGAGGAVRGLLGPLLEKQPQQIVIANRTIEKANQLISNFSVTKQLRTCLLSDIPATKFDLVINGISLHKIPNSLKFELKKDAVYYDLKYGTAAESSINWTAGKGFKTICDGWGMLVRQAAESYCIWQGAMPDPQVLIDNPELLFLEK